ncbi:sodium:solute symporter family transporter [Sphingomonas sp.]|uniref:sodium:solute symporter family transporter n=1 Tax=Sphingomonas sp. TaxID=28214 RepID=UPI003CC6A83E
MPSVSSGWRNGCRAIDERHLVRVPRVAVAILIAIVAARPPIGQSDQAFQFIQEFSGFFTSGITVIFVLGLFWKRASEAGASEAGAIAAAVASVLLSCPFRALTPDIAFMDRMALVFVICLALAVIASLLRPAGAEAIRIRTGNVDLETPRVFNVGAIGVELILVALCAT